MTLPLHNIFGHVQAGSGDCGLIRTAHGVYHVQAHAGDEERSGRSAEPPRSGSSHGVVHSLLGV